MGIISIEKANNLLWLGRYSERVFTTLKRYEDGFDRMLDSNPNFYKDYCFRLNIPDIYESSSDFISRYAYDTNNVDSIFSNLYRAYDNALVMRDFISSDSLAYIQLAIFQMKKARASEAPMVELQTVRDNLLAFWGCIDDCVDDIIIRNLIKVGRRIERLDLCLRHNDTKSELKRHFEQITLYGTRAQVGFDRLNYYKLALELEKEETDYEAAIDALENLIKM